MMNLVTTDECAVFTKNTQNAHPLVDIISVMYIFEVFSYQIWFFMAD